MDRPSILKPTLIGGAVFGLLGGIPLVSALNCLCCCLVMGGGFLAAYLYSNQCKAAGLSFSPGNGAKLGLVAGVFYAIVNSIIQGVLSIATGGPNFDEALEQAEQGGAPPEFLDAMERVFDVLSGPMGAVLMFVIGLVIALVFSTIGGLIGGAVFKNQPTPPGSPAGGVPGAPAGP